MNRPDPILHRDDPAKDPLGGNIKVTRQDWVNAGLAVLISDGVERVKILTLAKRMGVSRSSFYWYFSGRQDLLSALLEHWQSRNTAGLVGQAQAPSATITEAVCNLHRCVVNAALFDTALDFAVREWARRDAKVRDLVEQSDAERVSALTAMFVRHGYAPAEAETRAFVLYYMQIGYDLAQLNEPPEVRLGRINHYLYVFTGQHPLPREVEDFKAYARAQWGRDQGETK